MLAEVRKLLKRFNTFIILLRFSSWCRRYSSSREPSQIYRIRIPPRWIHKQFLVFNSRIISFLKLRFHMHVLRFSIVNILRLMYKRVFWPHTCSFPSLIHAFFLSSVCFAPPGCATQHRDWNSGWESDRSHAKGERNIQSGKYRTGSCNLNVENEERNFNNIGMWS